MSNSRFLLTNRVDTSPILNGTGGGAPAREETSPYIMERLQAPDRYTVWSTSVAPAGTTDVEFDMGIAMSIGAAAMLGIRAVSPGQQTAFEIYYAAAYPGGPWTLATASANANVGQRDLGKQFAAPVSARYWRFRILISGGLKFSVGRLWLGPVTDLGIKHSPGATSSPFRNRIEQGQANGTFVVNDLGDPGRDIQLPFNQIGASLHTTIEALSDQTGSFVYLDPDDRTFEVILRGGRVNSANLFSFKTDSIDLARLP